MTGEAIGAAALSDAGRRRLASEMDGPRPAGVERARTVRTPVGDVAAVEPELRTAPASKP